MRSTDEEERVGESESPWSSLRTLAVVGLLVLSSVLAGCSGVPFVGGGGPSVDASEEITKKIDVSPVTIYQRVEEMVGITADSYPKITVVYQGVNQDLNDNASGLFLRTIAGRPEDPDRTVVQSPHVYDPAQNAILLNISIVRQYSQARLQAIIAGEFFRAYMYQQNWTTYSEDINLLTGPISELGRTDGWMPQTLVRGAVNYVARAYADKHLSGTNVAVAPAWGPQATTYEKWYTIQRSRLGMQYFQRTLDSPAGLVEFFSGDVPVKTTEQLLHETAESPGTLTMRVRTGNWWTRVGPNVGGPMRALLPDPRNPRGELGIRYTLQSHLPTAKANAAAKGWAMDRVAVLRSFYANESRGVVWAIRWDSPAEAQEFVTAMETFVQNRKSEPPSVTFRIRRPTEDTTIVMAGTDDFQDLIEVTFSDYRVTVSTS